MDSDSPASRATPGPPTQPLAPAVASAAGKPVVATTGPGRPAGIPQSSTRTATPSRATSPGSGSVPPPPSPTTTAPTVRGAVSVDPVHPPVPDVDLARPAVEPRPAPAAAVGPPVAARATGPRRARLLVTRVDPWSVMKMAFMLAVSAGIVLLVATGLLWWTLEVTGVFGTVGRTIDDIVGTTSTSFDFLSLVSFSRVMGVALVLTAIEIVLWSALATLVAFLYNLSVGLTGGLEVTLSEDS